MLRRVTGSLQRWLSAWVGRKPLPAAPAPSAPPSPDQIAAPPLEPLRRIVLTDGVARTFFDDFAAHRRTDRGEEEIGWVLLGLREGDTGTGLAVLPAGEQRHAGVAHVQFNSAAQAVASRIVRRLDKRLTLLGIVHTHPGSLRRPSSGDYRGDSVWVEQLRGGEGIFGIGTADVHNPHQLAQRGDDHQQILGELCFSWFALGRRERDYRRLPVELTLGPDLARPLHAVWPILEEHAPALERLCKQQANATFEVLRSEGRPTLALTLPLAERGSSLKVLMDSAEVRYVLQERDRLAGVDPEEPRLDRAVYLILAELAASAQRQEQPAA